MQCPLNFWSCNKPLERVWINERKRVNANNYRKPFGDDLKSAKKLNNQISKSFKEEIFGIGHYLSKEMIQNIERLRF